MYDAADRRWLSMDPVSGTVTNSQTFVQYTYCLNNPLCLIDPLGLTPYTLIHNKVEKKQKQEQPDTLLDGKKESEKKEDEIYPFERYPLPGVAIIVGIGGYMALFGCGGSDYFVPRTAIA